MKFLVWLIIPIFAVVSQSALAAWPPKNLQCEKARISELSIFDGEKRTEICENSQIPNPEYLTAINDIADINSRASKLLNISLAELFPKGLAVDISASYAGLNGSAKAGHNSITLSIYTNPTRWVNKGIYAHELGHALQFSDNSKVPAALKGTFRSGLLGETTADTIAFALVGEETSHEPKLPLCFSAKRVNYNQSYVTQSGFFDSYYSLHTLSACCDEYADLNADTKNICENILTDEAGELITLPPYNNVPFNYLEKTSMEEHRIGIPINSFILTLGQHVEKDLFKDFIKAYSNLDPIPYECNFDGSENTKESIVSNGWSLTTQLQTLRSALSINQKISYDALWTELGLQAASIMDDAEILSRASDQAEKLFIPAIRKNKQSYKGKRHCAKVFENAESEGYPDNSCEIKCVKVK